MGEGSPELHQEEGSPAEREGKGEERGWRNGVTRKRDGKIKWEEKGETGALSSEMTFVNCSETVVDS